MQMTKVRGYVLGHTELSASRVIVTVFGEESGKRQGVFQFRGKASRVWLTPLSLVSYEARSLEHQELDKIGDLTLEQHSYEFASQYPGLCLLQHWALLVKMSQPDAHPDDRVFRLLTHCLNVCSGKSEAGALAAYNLYFESWLLHLCGILPRIRLGIPLAGIEEATDFKILEGLQVPIMQRLFFSKIIDIAPETILEEELARPIAILGRLWEQFLGKKPTTRKTLLGQMGLTSN